MKLILSLLFSMSAFAGDIVLTPGNSVVLGQNRIICKGTSGHTKGCSIAKSCKIRNSSGYNGSQYKFIILDSEGFCLNLKEYDNQDQAMKDLLQFPQCN